MVLENLGKSVPLFYFNSHRPNITHHLTRNCPTKDTNYYIPPRFITTFPLRTNRRLPTPRHTHAQLCCGASDGISAMAGCESQTRHNLPDR
jgi:hypothetical protein